MSNGVVHGYVRRARLAGLTWPLPEGLDDENLELLLFPAPTAASQSDRRPTPDWAYVEKELRRRSVTRLLLWEEYRAANPDGFGYTWFCTTFEAWKQRARPSMRQTHAGGEKVFVDFAGDTIDIFDPITGEVRAMKLFVAAMGASNYTYAEACPSESLSDWIGVHASLFRYLGGVPKFVVCDNLKAAVTNPDRYDPGINRTYAEMAGHYGTAILAARPRRPKDKAKVEVAVQIAQRWILARLRNQRFFSLAELNTAIRGLVVELNARQMRGFGSSRTELFAEIDRPRLRELPDQPYVFARWKRCRVAPDYHVEIDGHWYSTPYRLIRELVDVRNRRQDRRGLPQGTEDRQPRPCAQPARPHHDCRSYAQRPPPLRQMDTGRADRRRREDRSIDGGVLPGRHRSPAAPRARLSHLPRYSVAGQELRPCARRCRLPTRHPDQGSLRRLDPFDPQERPRSRFPRRDVRPPAPAPRQHPRSGLFPLNQGDSNADTPHP
ncbi:transposase [Bradyrhizobium sp. GM0.4]